MIFYAARKALLSSILCVDCFPRQRCCMTVARTFKYVLLMTILHPFAFWNTCLEYSPLSNRLYDSPGTALVFSFLGSFLGDTCSSYIADQSKYDMPLWIDAPIMAQFRVLGIRSISHSTFHPRCRLNDASQMRYDEYELALLPSPPRLIESTKPSGTGYAPSRERWYRVSNAQAQQGMDKYPEAEDSVANIGIQGVSSSA